jgi:hypothetical protein
MKKPADDILALRDAALRARVIALVEQSKGRITIADILRSAVMEKLDRIAQTGQFSIPVTFSAPAALSEAQAHYDAKPSPKPSSDTPPAKRRRRKSPG